MKPSARLLGCAAALVAATALPALAQEAVAVTQDPVVVVEPTPTPDVVVVEPAPVPTTDGGATPTPTPDVVVVVDPAPVPSPNAGKFDALPPGGQKIVQALYDAQLRNAPAVTAAGTTTATAIMSRDDIAAARGGTGWGNVFKQMQAQGLVQERNLGQVMSGRHVASVSATIPDATAATATTTRSGRHSAGAISYGNGAASTVSHGGGKHTASLSVTTAEGGGVTAGAGRHSGGGATAHGGGHHVASVTAASATVTAAAHGNSGGKGHGKVK